MKETVGFVTGKVRRVANGLLPKARSESARKSRQGEASRPHKPYFIYERVGGVLDRNGAEELGIGKAEDFLTDLPFVRPIE